MTRPADLPEELRHGPFDVRDALSLGVSAARLRRKDLRRPFRGVRAGAAQRSGDGKSDRTDPRGRPETAGQTWTRAYAAIRIRAREYATRMPTDQFFSHVTAAFLHELPLPNRLRDYPCIDVGTTVRTRRRKGAGVNGHLIPAARVCVVEVAALRVASVVDVWCQLGATLTVDELIIIGDALVRRQHPPATMSELEAAVARQAGYPGVLRLREAFALVRPRTDSSRETILRLIIVRAGLPEPEINAELLNSFGAFMAWGDLVYRRYKVLIEYDGGDHREDERQFHRDIDRLDEVMEEEWRVIRVNKSHLGPRRHELIARITRALLAGGWVPPV